VQNSETNPRLTIRLKSPWDKSSAWARILEDGRIELELYDFSPDAQAHMGNDVAWLYRVDPVHKPRIRELLLKRNGSVIDNDETLLEAFAQMFPHVHAIRDWFREEQIPYEEQFDSWA
jgi:hypothetical protein